MSPLNRRPPSSPTTTLSAHEGASVKNAHERQAELHRAQGIDDGPAAPDAPRGVPDPREAGLPLDRAYEREHYEPDELSNPLPKWFAAMSVGFVIWGAAYFYLQESVSANVGGQRSVLAFAADGPVDGATVYAGNCVACHPGTGLGIAGAFQPLAGSGWVLADPRVAAQILLRGTQGEIEVLGNTYNGAPATPELYAEQRKAFPADSGGWQGGAERVEKVGSPIAVGGS